MPRYLAKKHCHLMNLAHVSPVSFQDTQVRLYQPGQEHQRDPRYEMIQVSYSSLKIMWRN